MKAEQAHEPWVSLANIAVHLNISKDTVHRKRPAGHLIPRSPVL
jgi:hypothetical protein